METPGMVSPDFKHLVLVKENVWVTIMDEAGDIALLLPSKIPTHTGVLMLRRDAARNATRRTSLDPYVMDLCCLL